MQLGSSLASSATSLQLQPTYNGGFGRASVWLPVWLGLWQRESMPEPHAYALWERLHILSDVRITQRVHWIWPAHGNGRNRDGGARSNAVSLQFQPLLLLLLLQLHEVRRPVWQAAEVFRRKGWFVFIYPTNQSVALARLYPNSGNTCTRRYHHPCLFGSMSNTNLPR